MTYLLLAVPFVLVAVLVLVWSLRAMSPPQRRRRLIAVGTAIIVLFVLTAVFDSIMIATGLFAYSDEQRLGLEIGLAPIEDFAYPLVCALVVPAVWSLLSASGGDRVRTVLLSSRPISWVNTAYPFGAAYLLASGDVDWLFIVGTLFFLVPYNLLMYGVNDVFDYESDLRNPRKGGAEGALLGREVHRTVIWSGVITTGALGAWMLVLAGSEHPWSWLVLAVVVFAVVAYSAPGLRFKEVPVLDSITSSTHFVGPLVYGLVVAGATFTPELTALVVAFFCWGAASHAFGAVQDVVPDREANIASIATVFGARATVRIALSLWLVAGVLMLATEWPGPLASLLVMPYLAAAWPYRSVSDDNAARSNRGWKSFILINYVVGFVVTMLLIWWTWAR